ncbi:MAG: porin [Betaproteobacteria bacterium]|nr:porin [Betaproteobacteria bacterium]
MRKKILVAAVAGALAAPAVVLAQSSVTISGFIQMSVDNMKVSNPAPTRTTTSEGRLNDESTSVVFNIREDLGSGLAAIVRVDLKTNLDSSNTATSGESYIGFDSRSWGRLTAGRHNLHYFKTPSDAYWRGASLKVDPGSIIEFAGGGRVAIANATRTPNSIRWNSPNWSGFDVAVGYSFNPLGVTSPEADMTANNTKRKGQAWNLNPTYTAANWQVGYSYWNGKADAPSATAFPAGLATLSSAALSPATAVLSTTTAGQSISAGQLVGADQLSNALYGFYSWSGFKLGAMWHTAKLKAAATAAGLAPAGTTIGDRTAWSIPLRYETGPHTFMGAYTKARDDKATAVQDGAKMWSLGYSYGLSKRTFVNLSLAKLKNDVGGAYTPYTSFGSLGSVNDQLGAGEGVRILAFGIRHVY